MTSPQQGHRSLKRDRQDFGKGSQPAPDVTSPTHHSQGQKRKRSDTEAEVKEAFTRKIKRQILRKTADAFIVVDTRGADYGDESGLEACKLIAYWTHTGQWPEDFSKMSQEQSNSSKKRPTSSSYSKSFRDGEVPKAHTPAHEKHLAEQRFFMEELTGRSRVQQESKSLCTNLPRNIHLEPKYMAFPLAQFLVVWQRAQIRNEVRVYRDLTPLLILLPELL